MDWLTTIPSGVVRAHATMYARISAEESLLWSQRFAVGAGLGKPEDRRRVISEWERAAHAHPRFQTVEEQLEIVRAITKAMGGTVPGDSTKAS